MNPVNDNAFNQTIFPISLLYLVMLSPVTFLYSLPDVLSGLIWVRSVCRGYEQATLVGNESLLVPLIDYLCVISWAFFLGCAVAQW